MTDAEFQAFVKDRSQLILKQLKEASKTVVGQKAMMERILMAFLCEGHLLLEGLPGLAKTLAVKTIADIFELQFGRIQFTPDLMPADLIGSVIFDEKTMEFRAKKGPVFTNILLADEINRSPAKVQSALLEAMAERQVTLGDQAFPLPAPFMVLATQNPLEQEGTYALPEAQLDRFMFKVKVMYPTAIEERSIVDQLFDFEEKKPQKAISAQLLSEAQTARKYIRVEDKIRDYIVQLIFITRFPERKNLGDLKNLIQVGCSPRATISLTKASMARAFLEGRTFVIPEDVKSVAHDVLRHRLVLTYEAEASDVTVDVVIGKILDAAQVP
jgi:MoxR-like ATPase